MAINPAPLKRTSLVLLCLLTWQVWTVYFGKRYWLNLTSSEAPGLYRIEKLDRGLRRGDLVIMSVPEQFRQYLYDRRGLPDGWPLLKHVGAIPGDLFCVEGSQLTINGAPIGPVFQRDLEGVPLPRQEGCRRVPERHFLPVAVRIKNSFDGRYMGCVPVSAIKGLARPVLTF